MRARPRYTAEVHNKVRKYVGLYPAQQQTLNALNSLLVDVLPDYEDDVCLETGVINVKRFRGAFAHYNVKRAKTDVDTRAMQALHFHMKHRHLSGEEIDAAAARLGF